MTKSSKMANRVAGGFSPPAPTPPGMRYDMKSLFLLLNIDSAYWVRTGQVLFFVGKGECKKQDLTPIFRPFPLTLSH